MGTVPRWKCEIYFDSTIFGIEYRLFGSGNLTARSSDQRQATNIAMIVPSINNRVMDLNNYRYGFKLIEQNLYKRLNTMDIPKTIAEYAVKYKLA